MSTTRERPRTWGDLDAWATWGDLDAWASVPAILEEDAAGLERHLTALAELELDLKRLGVTADRRAA